MNIISVQETKRNIGNKTEHYKNRKKIYFYPIFSDVEMG